MTGKKFNNDSKFDIDLRVGQQAEQSLATILEVETVEVKRDFRALETGNIGVEFESWNKPSGIEVTEAKHWAFVLGDITILIETERLRHFYEFYKAKKRIVFCGDCNASKMVLIPIGKLFKGNLNDLTNDKDKAIEVAKKG